MKRTKTALGLLLCGILVLTSACTSTNDPSKTTPDPVQKEIINQMFAAGQSSSGISYIKSSDPGVIRQLIKSSTATAFPIPTTTTNGPNGGTLTLSGNMDMSVTTSGETLTMTLSEVFSNYGIIADTKTYTISGTIAYTGNYDISQTKMSAVFSAKGNLTVTGTDYNKQMAVDLTETMNVSLDSSQKPTSTSVTVTGSIGGQTLNYTVTK